MCRLSIGIDLERFEHFKDAEFRSLDIISAVEIHATFAVQDKARDFDWITVCLKFFGVSDAKLLESNKIAYIDMSDGVTIFKSDGSIAFGIGECYNILGIKNASCYIIAADMKSVEGTF